MIYFRETLDFKIEEPTVITFGKFDGLHRGHELLMETVLQTAKEQSCAPVVFTFDIPPKSMIAGQENKVLTTNEEKHFIFEQTGISYLIECPFTAQVRNMSPKDFIAWIVNSLSVTCIITGTDFRFGKDRMGDYHTLQQYEKEFGYKTIILDKIQEDGRDISSTFVREEIYKGNIEKANHLLGYDFFIKSTVVHGKALGRTIGIPTINMVVPKEKLLPPNGVYVTRVHIQDKCFPGVTNIG